MNLQKLAISFNGEQRREGQGAAECRRRVARRDADGAWRSRRG